MARNLEVTEDPKVKDSTVLAKKTGTTFMDSDEVDLFGDSNVEIMKEEGKIVPHPSTKTKKPMPLGATKEEFEKAKNIEREKLQNAEPDEEGEVDEVEEDVEEVDNEAEGDVEEESEEADDSEEEEGAEEKAVVPEEFDIDEDEYQSLVKQSKDELIARMLKHRKGNATLQSTRGKIDNALGKDVVDSILDGSTNPQVVRKLISDIKDSEAFQNYVSSFYDKHQLKDGKYVKVSDEPDMDTLSKYSELVVKKASLDINDYMPDGDSFDPGQAFISGTPSYKAKLKYEKDLSEVDAGLNAIIQASATADAQRKQSVQENQKRSEERFKDIINSNKIFKKDGSAEGDFRSFIQKNSSDLLSTFFDAWRYNRMAGDKTRTLVLNEKNAVAKNNGKVKIRPTKVSTRPEKPVKSYQEDEVFGDL
jgi:hypothetical protein